MRDPSDGARRAIEDRIAEGLSSSRTTWVGSEPAGPWEPSDDALRALADLGFGPDALRPPSENVMTVRLRTGDTAECFVDRVGEHLCVKPATENDGSSNWREWTISHYASGRRIPLPVVLEYRHYAIRMAEALDEAFDWSDPTIPFRTQQVRILAIVREQASTWDHDDALLPDESATVRP